MNQYVAVQRTDNVVTPIVALDVSTRAAAQSTVAQLGDLCGFYKVGLQLYSAEGPGVVQWLRDAGKKVFVDLKLHDIPNTVEAASRAIAKLGASLLTVHATGGEAMLRAGVSGAKNGDESCEVLAVTVLTSFDSQMLDLAWGRSGIALDSEVVRLAAQAHEAGAGGVVCSGHELASVKRHLGMTFKVLVPGMRLAGGDEHDQLRVITPDFAAREGADFLVVGRAVTKASDPSVAMARVLELLRNV